MRFKTTENEKGDEMSKRGQNEGSIYQRNFARAMADYESEA